MVTSQHGQFRTSLDMADISNWSSASAGVCQASVFRGLVLRAAATATMSSALCAEIGAFWKILAQQSVGVLVGAALPWAVRIAEIDLDASVDLQACVLSHLSSLIPSQRPCSGKVIIVRVMASHTASAPCPASAGPFFTRA